MELSYHDLQFVLTRAPWGLLHVMRKPEWAGKIFVGGGFIRSVVAGDEIRDVDVFVRSKADAEALSIQLAKISPEQYAAPMQRRDAGIIETDNAITLTKIKPTVQIVHRWVFEKGVDVANSFDFTICF